MLYSCENFKLPKQTPTLHTLCWLMDVEISRNISLDEFVGAVWISRRWWIDVECQVSKWMLLYTTARSFVLGTRSTHGHWWWQKQEWAHWLQISCRWNILLSSWVEMKNFGKHQQVLISTFYMFRKWGWYISNRHWHREHHNAETSRCGRTNCPYSHGKREKNCIC